jgi:hypothetical protein
MVPVPPSRAARLRDALDHLEQSSPHARGQAFPRLKADLEEATGGRFEVTAPRAVLRELIAVALDEAGEALATACRRLLRGQEASSAVRERVAEVTDLLDLLDSVEPRG